MSGDALERRCACGHYESEHRRPLRLVAWLWRFEHVYIARPCRAVFHKAHGDVKCECPRFRHRAKVRVLGPREANGGA